MNFINKKWTAGFVVIIVYMLPLVFTSCTKKTYNSKTTYQFKSETGLPEYSDLSYWAAHPWKWDPSDSIPKSILDTYIKDSTVDVFFLHPTTLTNFSDKSWNAKIDDSAINQKTDYSTILYQASVFNEKCRVFAPRYRQAHIRSYFTFDTADAKAAFDLAYNDIKMAFEYYLANWNNGRPIIIASHSQGTTHALRLLKEFFDGTILQNKLVCAYIIGMPIPENSLTHIPVCKDSNSTGCFVGWRTFKKGYTEPKYIAKENFKCVVINPLSWTTDENKTSRKLNTGGILKDFTKIVPKVVNAKIHNNVLWTCKPKFFGNIFLKSKNYHIGDINLFYTNIQTNVNRRIAMFWKTH